MIHLVDTLDHDRYFDQPTKRRAGNGLLAFQGPPVDTMAIYYCDTLGHEFPHEDEESQVVLPFLIESFFRSTEPRENLVIQMVIQSLGLHLVKGNATIVSLCETELLIVTSYMDALLATLSSKCRITAPGKNTAVALINRTCNTEDGSRS